MKARSIGFCILVEQARRNVMNDKIVESDQTKDGLILTYEVSDESAGSRGNE